MLAKDKTVAWTGSIQQNGLDILTRGGGMIVSPTKVGYIIMTSDRKGLDRKFDAKVRNRNKPGVVLCGSMSQLRALAELTPEIDAFYQAHWDADILLGCILPWRSEATSVIPEDGSRELVMDNRMTSCFVIRFGTPSEQLAERMWNEQGRVAFASSANPSGKGNRGVVEGIGERIEVEADLIISANDYVASIQPAKDADTRYEQGVMVSMVDEAGKLIPEQKGERMVSPAPTLIRKGLDVDRIMSLLSDHFLSWDYRQGQYY
ncbi:Sua5/YciO/YrdC/YwlC family protein [Sphingomonas sp. PP-CE-1G-424]|uniref:L-threonylcarbamoyladenylate synthase n=1 Tax=Sphingomonas sp. PP-CE-1G-424 TaxID=2135658 RepID=UPI001055E544|nr:Sua5/YciO/YrdC/YwlC family protein [Sphingomonas sp. PP-CE-1G-424]TCP64302.1 tRNA A37 threonylcarbamoyladenosine synthetase subunit TsaC/SUA5/YrdC [Sphingomonas sp. PP-CE-1G-424]